MNVPIYQIDAFTSEVFKGNPAAVCPLEEWPADEILQSIALENNLSETAFFVRRGESFELRWFTPSVEIDLCGHATLASAFVLYEHLGWKESTIGFDTRSGRLSVSRKGDLLTLDFPSRPAVRVETLPDLSDALGAAPVETWKAVDLMAAFENEDKVRALTPDMNKLARLEARGIIVTAPGRDCDFVSRFFAPAKGVPEDPVTGSAHCTLIPFWGERLKKTSLFARQVSFRGGELFCEWQEPRVQISGRAVMYLQGTIRF